LLFLLNVEIVFETGTFIELPFGVIKLRDIFTQELCGTEVPTPKRVMKSFFTRETPAK